MRLALTCALLTLLVFAFPGSAAFAAPPTGHEFVLAVSWESGFCATAEGEDKRECRSMTASRFDASHFSLHGLWPDDLDDAEAYPCYCGDGAPVSCDRSQPSEQVFVAENVFRRLRTAMPGTQSGLHRHEWTKHGTCYGTDVDEYFSDAILLLDQLNASPLQRLFEERIGDGLSRDEIEAAFDAAFGAGAGDRVALRCGGRGRNRLITGIDINLGGEIAPDAELGQLILAAPPVRAGAQSCNGGKVAGAP